MIEFAYVPRDKLSSISDFHNVGRVLLTIHGSTDFDPSLVLNSGRVIIDTHITREQEIHFGTAIGVTGVSFSVENVLCSVDFDRTTLQVLITDDENIVKACQNDPVLDAKYRFVIDTLEADEKESSEQFKEEEL